MQGYWWIETVIPTAQRARRLATHPRTSRWTGGDDYDPSLLPDGRWQDKSCRAGIAHLCCTKGEVDDAHPTRAATTTGSVGFPASQGQQDVAVVLRSAE